MSKADEPAFPCEQIDQGGCTPQTGKMRGGLTKRGYFAAMAMQGMLASITCSRWEDEVVKGVTESAIYYADALLAELEKEPRK